MKTFECRKCNSADLFIKDSGTQVGLYCSDCGAWQKWLNKEEKVLAENFIESNRETIVKRDNVSSISICTPEQYKLNVEAIENIEDVKEVFKLLDIRFDEKRHISDKLKTKIKEE